MPTTITLPEHLARQLQQRAVAHQRTPEALAIDLIALGLGEMATDASPSATAADPELSAVVARITATPPNPDCIIPARGNLADLLRSLDAMEGESDVAAETVGAKHLSPLHPAMNRADDVAEGRG
jgi:plasmid stability protein